MTSTVQNITPLFATKHQQFVEADLGYLLPVGRVTPGTQHLSPPGRQKRWKWKLGSFSPRNIKTRDLHYRTFMDTINTYLTVPWETYTALSRIWDQGGLVCVGVCVWGGVLWRHCLHLCKTPSSMRQAQVNVVMCVMQRTCKNIAYHIQVWCDALVVGRSIRLLMGDGIIICDKCFKELVWSFYEYYSLLSTYDPLPVVSPPPI